MVDYVTYLMGIYSKESNAFFFKNVTDSIVNIIYSGFIILVFIFEYYYVYRSTSIHKIGVWMIKL